MAANEYDALLGPGDPAGAAVTPVNEYDTLIDSGRDQQKQALQGAMFVATKTEPDRRAKAQQLADRMKIPVDVAERQYDTLSKREAESATDYDGLIDKSPKLAEWLSDPNNAAVARDDIDNLGKVEQTVSDHSMMSTMYSALNSGLASMYSNVARVPALTYDAFALPQNLVAKYADIPELAVRSPDWLMNNPVAKYYDQAAESFKTPEMERSITEEISKGNYSRAGMTLAAQFVANAPQQAALIAGMLAGYGVPALVGAGVTTAADANKTAQASGVDPATATVSALAKGTVEAGFESLGTFGVLKTWEGIIAKQYGKAASTEVFKDFAKTIAYSVAAEGNEEALTSAAQDMVDYVTGVNPLALEGLAGRALDAGIVGGFSGGLMTGPSASLASAHRGAQARKSTLARDFYLAMGKSAEATKLKERLPEGKRKFVEELTKNTPVENIFISTEALETYFQSKNVNPTAAIQEIGALDAYTEAKEAGHDVEIPLATWAHKVVGTEHYEALANDIKFDPAARSVNELKAEGVELKEELGKQADAAAISPELAQEASREESAAKVGESVATQLKAAGVAPADADVQASLFKERSKVRGDLLGETPEAVFNRHGLEIRRQDSAQVDEQAMGQTFEQSGNLDMSQEARLSRAQGMGFDTSKPLFHGTAADIKNFKISSEPKTGDLLGQGVYLTSNTDEAGQYATRLGGLRGYSAMFSGLPEVQAKARELYPELAGVNDPDELLRSIQNTRGKSAQYKELMAFADEQEAKGGNILPVYAKVQKAFDTSAKVDKKLVAALKKEADIPKDIHAALSKVKLNYELLEFMKGRLPAYRRTQMLEDLGYDAVTDGPVTMVFNPNQIRSVHAAFDPSESKSPNILYQGESAADSRGRISFGKNKTIIDLFRSANLSTFLHEGGHLWLSEVSQDFATLAGRDPSQLNERQQRFLKDAQAILDYLGAESFDSITRDQHETFARSIEAYLMEGKAPSAALRKAFATFKVWLIQAYQKMAGLRVTLTPEIRSVMDRMLASEEEVEAVKREMRVEPLFTDPAKMGMSAKQTHAYLAAIFDAEESAKEELNSKLMHDYARAQSAVYKEERVHVREAIEKEVSELPVYVAIDKIRANREVKLSRKALDEYGKDVKKALPRGLVASKADGEGLHPDVAAPILGYVSGSELVSALTSAKDKNALIDERTDAKMAEIHPDLLTNGKLPEEALKAVHNQSRSKLLRMELEHLVSNHLPVFKDSIRRVARRMPTDAQVREQAQLIVESKSVKDMKPILYQRAEIRAAKAAGVALAKGDIDAAFSAKRSELLNHELYRATTAARESMDEALEDFKKLGRSDEQLAKSRDMDLVNTTRAILADVGIGESDKPSSAYVEKIKRYDPVMFETVQALIEGVSGKDLHYSQLKYGEFMAVKDSVDALWGLSKSTRQIEISGQILDREEVKAQLSEQIGQIVEPKAKAGYAKAVTNWDKTKLKLLGARASLTRVEAFVEAADLGNPDGPFRKYIWNPVSEATTKYRLEKQAVIKKYEGLLKDWAKGLERKPIDAPELGYTFRDKAELMMAILHSGNDSNLDKLLRGRNWGEQNPDGIADRSRFDRTVARLQAEGALTKQDYDFAQAVWDLMDETKVGAQKAHKAIHGYYFNEITANDVVTPYGVYRGGYIPAKVDLYTTEDASIRHEREAFENNNNSFQFPTTGRGFTKSRTDQYAAPLSLEMSMLAGHIDGVMRFSYIEPTVRSVARITQDKGLRETLAQLDPVVGKELLTPWLQRAAQQKVVLPSDNGIGKAMDSVASFLRRSVAMQIMVGSVTNTLQQFTGVVVAASKVKPVYLRNALATYVRDIKGTTNSIMEKSEWMQSTQGATIYESHQAIEKIIVDPSTFASAQNFALRHTYFLQTAAQNIVNTVVWTAAYEQAIAAKSDEKSAALQADSAVRMTQGSNNPEDVSRFETGTATSRLFTQFAGYFNMLANLNGSELAKISREVGLKRGAGRAFSLYLTAFMIPAVLSEVLVKAMAGKGLDEDDDGYLNDLLAVFFGSQAKTAFALVPYGGQALNATLNNFNGNRNDDRLSLSPVVSFIETMTGVPAEVYKTMNGENANNKRVVKDVLTFLGTASSLPIGPLGKPVGYLMDVSEGKARPSGPVDYARGLVTGKPGKAN